MALSEDDTKSLLKYVASAKADELDCDHCFDHMAEFVEKEIEGSEIPEALLAIKRHLDQCACCKDEHNALLEALRELEDK